MATAVLAKVVQKNRAMKLRKYLVCLVVLTTVLRTEAQEKTATRSSVESITLTSTILEEDRELQVYLPEGYDEKKEYPVLYILDGQRLFNYGVSLQKSFKHFRQTPDFIIVGINNLYPDRFSYFSSHADLFQQFLNEEVLSYVGQHYSVSNERILFGWEYGGGFVIQTMMDNTPSFDGYIAASSYPISDPNLGISESRMKQLQDFMRADPETFLFFAVSEGESVVEQGTDYLAEMLDENSPANINWSYHKLAGEEHQSTPYATLYRGLRAYYEYYPQLSFSTLNEFLQAGGIEYMYEYNLERHKQYGFDKELTAWQMFSAVRNAMRADNYDEFHKLVSTFNESDFISSTRVDRSVGVGVYYMDNGKYLEAIEIFEKLHGLHPESKLPLTRLVEVYEKSDNKKMTRKYKKILEGLG